MNSNSPQDFLGLAVCHFLGSALLEAAWETSVPAVPANSKVRLGLTNERPRPREKATNLGPSLTFYSSIWFLLEPSLSR